jgi:UPF0716 protein FxsA
MDRLSSEMLFLILFIALIGIPLLEIYVVIQVGEAIGVLATLALLILDALAGAALMRSQGRAVWSQARRTLAAGRPPTREILDGALVIAGGALLIAPGFITDLLGALLLVPPTRAIARRLVVRHFMRKTPKGRARMSFTSSPGARRPDYDYDSDVIEVDPRQLEG